MSGPDSEGRRLTVYRHRLRCAYESLNFRELSHDRILFALNDHFRPATSRGGADDSGNKQRVPLIRTPPLSQFSAPLLLRPRIEGTLFQGVRAFGMRRSRYIGLAKTPLQHVPIATAINLVRVMAGLTAPHPTKPRASPFAALGPPVWEFASRVNTRLIETGSPQGRRERSGIAENRASRCAVSALWGNSVLNRHYPKL
jgi:hypothetical protein